MGKEIKPIHTKDEDSSGKFFEDEKMDKYYKESGDLPIEKDYTGKSLAQEINDDLTTLVDDFKLALDCLFDVIDEDYAEQASGFGYTHKEKVEKINRARSIYYKHFA